MALTTSGLALLISFVATIGIQLFFFFIAYTLQIDKLTDIAGSMNFVLTALLSYFLGGTFYTRQTVVTVAVCIWGFRLGLFLLWRVCQRGHDARFDEMRAKFWSFLGFWVYQMMWVFLVGMPYVFLNGAENDVELNNLDYVAWVMWSVGFVCEAVADQQKYFFNANSENKGKLLKTGVYSWTRHPNYFGEIIMWLAVFLTCSNVFQDNTLWGYASVISPIFTFLILMFLSGVKLSTARYEKRFGDSEEWKQYKAQTSMLIPLPPFLYSRFPSPLKWICCNFPMFGPSQNPESSSLVRDDFKKNEAS
jgi:steroid 5-alpha reductase family enzyme